MWTTDISCVLLCFCLLSSIETGVGGLHCFECEDLYKPYLCDFVTTCTDGQQCYVDEYITSSGNVLYKSGCRSSQRCSVTKRDLGTKSEDDDINYDVASDVASDILFCSECCNNTEYCNKEGCQQTDGEKMGPFCFDCRRQGKNACRRVTQCDRDEVCEISTEVINGLTLYNSRCANPLSSQICAGTSRDPVQLLVGKRDDTIVHSCPKCCGSDFCNSDCNVTSSPVDGAWSDWSSWSDCSSTCGSGLTSRSRTCSNPPPSNHGQGCAGDANQTQICTTV